MSGPGHSAHDDFTRDVLDEAAFALALAGIPELAHLPAYNMAAVPAARRHLGESLDIAELARRSADPNTPPDALIFLAGICPAEFSANPVLPLLLLEDPALPARFEPASLGRLLSYAGVPADFLAAVAQLGQPELAHAARLHIGLAGEVGPAWRDELERAIGLLPTIPGDDLLLLLLALGLVPPWLRGRIAAGHDPRLSAALAAGAGDRSRWADIAPAPPPPAPDTGRDEATLSRMLDSEDAAVRALAAADPRTPPALLAEARAREDWFDSDMAVYRALAGNPGAPAELLTALAAEKMALFTGVRRAVALNPGAPAEALALLVDEPYADDIPLLLAAHPNLSPEQRERMATSALDRAWAGYDPFYRAIALASPGAPDEWLAGQARAPSWLERVAVALNPRSPAAARALLAEDGNRLVRAAAREGR